MKNIQVIDGAENCVYDIFAASDQEFSLIFPDDHDVAFIDEVRARANADAVRADRAGLLPDLESQASQERGAGHSRYFVLRKRAQEGVLPDST